MTNNKWYSIKMLGEDHAEVMIYDDIGMYGITAKQFASEFGDIKAKSITLRINSYGGEVFDGFAIYQAIRSHAADVAVVIDGIAASIASVIAMAGKSLSIAQNAYLMIHNPWNMAMGDATELRKQADLLDKLGKTAAEIYAQKCGKSVDECLAIMGAETWYTAEEAKAAGFVDSVVDGNSEVAPAAIARAVLKFNPPEKLRRIAASLIQRSAEVDIERQQREAVELKEAQEFLTNELNDQRRAASA